MSAFLWISLGMVLMGFSAHAQDGLHTGFYSWSCPRGKAIERSTVEKYFNKNSSIAAGLLRLHFHDCCVQVLILGVTAERTAVENSVLRGFEVIEDAKSWLEAVCPWVVSCADILLLAARDSVDLSGGPIWSVPLGRRDGRISSASDATSLPSPLDSVAIQRTKFTDKRLTVRDLITLVDAHTICQSDCLFFRYHLYNFTTISNADPSIDQAFLSQHQVLCSHNGDASKWAALDTGSLIQFDVSYFNNVRDGQGLLESDQQLWEDFVTQNIVQNYVGNIRGLFGLRCNYDFPKSMIKMSSIGVKTENQREIRKICSKFK